MSTTSNHTTVKNTNNDRTFLKSNLEGIIVLIIFVSLLLVCTFIDLWVSETLYESWKFFGHAGDKFGQIPGFLAVGFAGGVLFVSNSYKDNNGLLYVMSILAIMTGALVTTEMIFYGIFQNSTMIGLLTVLSAVGLSYIFIVLARLLVNEEDSTMYVMISFIILIFIILVNVIMLVLKNTWTRPRYYSIISGENEFRNWFVPGFLVGEFRPFDSTFASWPSGHTTIAYASIGMSLLFINKKAVYNIVFVICLLIGFMVGISRIVEGSHFATDVLSSGILVITTFMFAKHSIIKRI